jgi:23S rRNA-intervening sequence protein
MTAPRVAAWTFQDLVVWRKAHELVLAESGQSAYMNMAEGSLEESRYYLILAQDLGYGDTSSLTTLLEEVSRLLSAYGSAILASDFHIPKGYQGRSPRLVRFRFLALDRIWITNRLLYH